MTKFETLTPEDDPGLSCTKEQLGTSLVMLSDHQRTW
jgi:hypothetical protein